MAITLKDNINWFVNANSSKTTGRGMSILERIARRSFIDHLVERVSIEKRMLAIYVHIIVQYYVWDEYVYSNYRKFPRRVYMNVSLCVKNFYLHIVPLGLSVHKDNPHIDGSMKLCHTKMLRSGNRYRLVLYVQSRSRISWLSHRISSDFLLKRRRGVMRFSESFCHRAMTAAMTAASSGVNNCRGPTA